MTRWRSDVMDGEARVVAGSHQRVGGWRNEFKRVKCTISPLLRPVLDGLLMHARGGLRGEWKEEEEVEEAKKPPIDRDIYKSPVVRFFFFW